MTRPKEKKAEAGISYRNGMDFFSKLEMSKTLSLMVKLFPECDPVQRSPNVISMHCPLPDHEDKKASFEINVIKGTASCRSTFCQYFTRNPIDLIQRCKGWAAKDCLEYIQAESQTKLVSERQEREIESLDLHQWAMRTLFAVCTQHLKNCISPPADDIFYTDASLRIVKDSLDWLFITRGHDASFIDDCSYGLMPPMGQLRKMCETWLGDHCSVNYAKEDKRSHEQLNVKRREKILAIIKTITEKIPESFVHCPTYHLGHSTTTPARLRIRRPKDEKQDNIYVTEGFTPDEPLGYFNLYSERTTTMLASEDLLSIVYLVVEGEHDCIAVMEGILQHGIVGFKVIAACGNANVTDQLFHAGITSILLLPDEPSAAGKGNQFVKLRLETAYNIDVYVFNAWLELMDGSPKDPFDAIRHHKFEKCWKLFAVERSRTYITADRWAINQAIDAVGEISEEEIKQRTAKAAEYGQCVRHPALMARYIEEVCKATGIEAGVLRTEIIRAKDNEAGFISRIVNHLRDQYHIVKKQSTPNGGILYMFHKQSRRMIDFQMTNSEAIINALSSIHGNVVEHFRKEVGLFGTGADPNTEGLSHTYIIKETHKELVWYVKFAIQEINEGVPTDRECIKVGQGLHRLVNPDNPREYCGYFVTGVVVYKINWILQEGKEPQVSVRELEGPSDGPYLFELEERRSWSTLVKSKADLNGCNDITLQDVRGAIRDVYRMFNECWRWKNQDLDSTFLAWHIFSFAVHCAFTTKVFLALLGETTSGKSTAMSVFSGSQYKDIQLLECCIPTSNYTVASVKQIWDASTLGMGLEEFEDDGDTRYHKSQQVGNINELLRQCISDTGVAIKRGTLNGKADEYTIHTNIITTAIVQARQGQDENRRFSVETSKVEGLQDPRISVKEMYSPERFLEIKRILNLGLIRWIPDLVKIHDEFVKGKEFNSKNISEKFIVPTRYTRNFIPLSAVMKLLDVEYMPFVRATCEARQASIQSASQDTKCNLLFSLIFRVPTIPTEGQSVSVAQCLTQPDRVARTLNRASCGVYYDEEHYLLIIDWVTVINPGGLLNRVDEVRNTTPRSLKHLFDQHPQALKHHQIMEMKVLDFMKKIETPALASDISVANIKDIVLDLRATKQSAPSPSNGNGHSNPKEAVNL